MPILCRSGVVDSNSFCCMPQNTTDRCSINNSMKTPPFAVLSNVICLYFCRIIRLIKFQTPILDWSGVVDTNIFCCVSQNITVRRSINKSMKTPLFSVLLNTIYLYYCLIIRPRKFEIPILRWSGVVIRYIFVDVPKQYKTSNINISIKNQPFLVLPTSMCVLYCILI